MLILKLMLEAALWIVVASARTTADEMAATWEWKEALRRGAASAVDGGVVRPGRDCCSAQCAEHQDESGEERSRGLASKHGDSVPLGKRVGIVARSCRDPSDACTAVERPFGFVAPLLEAEHFGSQRFLGVAEGKVAAIGGRGGAALVRRALEPLPSASVTTEVESSI